jgi:hypothetical protein
MIFLKAGSTIMKYVLPPSWISLAVALLALALPATARAAHPLITDDAGTAGRGNFLVEINSEFARDDEAGTEETGGELALSLTAGLGDNLDLVLGLPYAWSKVREGGAVTSEEDGVSDASVEVKWRFLENDGLALALKPGITLPTGDDEKGLGTGRVCYSLFFIATREFEGWALHANLGYGRNEFSLAEDDEASRHDIWHASVAAEAALTEDLTAVANLGIETNEDRASNAHPAFALAGIIYSLSENVDIDLGMKAGLTGAETDLAVLAGTAISF